MGTDSSVLEQNLRSCFGDRRAVEAIRGVEVGKAAGLPELLDAKRRDALPADSAEPGQRSRSGVGERYEACIAPELPKQLLDVTGLALTRPAPRLRCSPVAVQQVGGGDRKQPQSRNVLAQLFPCREC